jgi:formylglycine-generating enzyme required for sulfatase activity
MCTFVKSALVACLALAAGVALASCGAGNTASQLVKTPEYAPAGQAKCSVEKSQPKPLIVEWPSPDRVELESTLRQGLAVVHYAGCELSLLNRCRVSALYRYTGATRTEDRVEVKDEDELYANLPMGAMSLSGTLHRAGKLTVDMQLVGRLEADRTKVWGDELVGDCAGATHFVYGVTVGAFDFYAGGSADIGGQKAGMGGASHAERESLTKAGDQNACSKATSWDKAPPEGCGALIRIEVVPIEAARAGIAPPPANVAAPGPAPAPPQGRPAAATGSDSARMVAVSGGTFTMGDRRDTVHVTPFLLDPTEVTADAYAACVRAGGCSDDGLRCDGGGTYGIGGRGDHPITCVDYDQATAYCAWTRKRLPTEEEWEWAARGQAAGWTYPWGDGPPISQLCWRQGGTCPVGTFTAGDAPGGIHDLAGNAWEWTSTDYGAGERVFRGGSWHSTDPAHPRAAYRNHRPPGSHFAWLGFRCAAAVGFAPASVAPSSAGPLAPAAPEPAPPAPAPEVQACTARASPRDQAFCYLKTESEEAIDPLFEIGHAVSHEVDKLSITDASNFRYAAENAGMIAAKTHDTRLYAGLKSPHRSARLFAVLALRQELVMLRVGLGRGKEADAPVRAQRLPAVHATCLAALADPASGALVTAAADCLKEIGDASDGPPLLDAIVRYSDDPAVASHLAAIALPIAPYPPASLVKLRPVLEHPIPERWTHDSVFLRRDICKLLLRETPATEAWAQQAAVIAVHEIGNRDGMSRQACEDLANRTK